MKHIQNIIQELQKEFPQLDKKQLEVFVQQSSQFEPSISVDPKFKQQLSEKLETLSQLQTESSRSYVVKKQGFIKYILGFSGFAFCLGAFAFVFSSYNFFDTSTTAPDYKPESLLLDTVEEEKFPSSSSTDVEEDTNQESIVQEQNQGGDGEEIIIGEDISENREESPTEAQKIQIENITVQELQEEQAKGSEVLQNRISEKVPNEEKVEEEEKTPVISQEDYIDQQETNTVVPPEPVIQTMSTKSIVAEEKNEEVVEPEAIKNTQDTSSIKTSDTMAEDTVTNTSQDIFLEDVEIIDKNDASMIQNINLEQIKNTDVKDQEGELLKIYTDSSLPSQFQKFCTLYKGKYITEKELCMKEKVQCFMKDFITEGEKSCSFFNEKK